MGELKGLRIFLVCLNVLAFLAVIFFNLIAGFNDEDFTFADEFSIFKNSVGNISDKYILDVTPADWTVTIWAVIYVYLLIIVTYCVTTLCRGDASGKLFYSPPFLSIDFYVFFFLNMGCNVAWLFMWDREYLEAALAVLMLNVGTLVICIISVMRGIRNYGGELISMGRRSEIGAVYGIIINGLGMYTAWVCVATLINLGVVLTYVVDVKQDIASCIVLGCLTLDIVVYVYIETACFERYFRYMFTPYMVLIFALIGILWRSKDDLEHPYVVFNVALLACAAFLFVAKIGRAIVKDRQQNFYSSLETDRKQI